MIKSAIVQRDNCTFAMRYPGMQLNLFINLKKM